MAATRKPAKKKAARKPVARKRATAKRGATKAASSTRAKAKGAKKRATARKVSATTGLKKKFAKTVKAARRGLMDLGEAGGHALERARDAVADAAESVKETVAARL